MTNQLYYIALPDAKTATSDAAIAAQIQQYGLLLGGGVATEKEAIETIDLSIEGRWDFGETFAKKLADELESLGESNYSGIPLYDPEATDSGRQKGYYELQSVDVSPAHPNTRDVYEYTAALSFTGTKQDHWRRLNTRVETISHSLATGTGGLIGIPATASKVRWFDTGSGTESATADSTVTGEFGEVDLYDPTQPSFDNPELLYEVDYADEREVDVRAFDDLNLSKYYTVNSQDFNRWPHVFHQNWEFDGRPVVDNGLQRLRFDESAGVVELYEWDTGTSSWSEITIDHTDWTLIDADFTRMGPADTRAYCEFDGGESAFAILSVQRGNDRPVARAPEGSTWSSAFETYLGQFVSTQTTDPKPEQGLKPRSELR